MHASIEFHLNSKFTMKFHNFCHHTSVLLLWIIIFGVWIIIFEGGIGFQKQSPAVNETSMW